MKRYRRPLFLLMAAIICTFFVGSAYKDFSPEAKFFSQTSDAIERISALGETYYFVHLEENVEFHSQWIDVSSCNYHHLYLFSSDTNTITLVSQQLIRWFVENENYLLANTLDNRILQISKTAGETTIYQSQYGEVDLLRLKNNKLYFVDEDRLMLFDFETMASVELAFCKDIVYLYPRQDGTVAWENESGMAYMYVPETEKQVPIDYIAEAIDDNEKQTVDKENITRDYSTQGFSGEVDLPLDSYPSTTSYFSNNGQACSHHGTGCSVYGTCGCRSYANSIQCMGFAKYASDQYFNRSSWSQTGADVKHQSILQLTAASASAFFDTYGKGTYVRVSNTRNSDGTHSFVIVSTNASGITLYEANYPANCRVNLRTRTYQQLVEEYPYVLLVVSHTLSGAAINYNDSYHKKTCSVSSCTATRLQPHYAQVPGSNATCLGCGYRGYIAIGLG